MHILLPPLAKLRTVVERLRPLADEVVAIYANHAGSVKICAQTESARVDVMWKGLPNPGKSACLFCSLRALPANSGMSRQGSRPRRRRAARPGADARRAGVPQESAEVLEQPRGVDDDDCLCVRSFAVRATRTDVNRHMQGPLHYPVCLHRRGGRLWRGSDLLHPRHHRCHLTLLSLRSSGAALYPL